LVIDRKIISYCKDTFGKYHDIS